MMFHYRPVRPGFSLAHLASVVGLLAILFSIFCALTVWGGEVNEVETLRKRVKELEVEQLKLRLNLADEKLVNARMEFNMLTVERGRICNELSATDQKVWADRCTERKQ